MRIRKRQVPLPLSSLTPVPLSDPLLSRSPGVQLRPHDNSSLHHLAQEADRLSHLDSPPSDQRNQPIVAGSTDQDRSRDGGGGSPEVKEVLPEKKDERDGEEEKRSNDAGKGTCLGAKIGTMVSRQPTSSSAQVGSWCEGEKSFPVKKRVGASFERRSRAETIMEKHKKMKTKMNKKCVAQNGNEEGGKKDIESKDAVDGGTTSGKKRGRGGALLEGSRCSRVNGRGWRCCQQTLVGYSLCEHHLGKGRLRSMNSVRSRSAPKKVETGQQISGPPSTEEKERKGAVSSCKLEVGGERAGDEKQPLMISNKKMKLGMVKARSISSLLGQANDTVEVTDSYN